MPLLAAALFAKVPTEEVHILSTGKLHLRAFHQVEWQYIDMAPHCSALYQHHCCLLQLMPLLEAALFAKVPTEDLQRLLTGESHLGPFFKWTGALRAAFAKAESYNEASGRWGAVSRRLMAAYLRSKNVASLKVSAKKKRKDYAFWRQFNEKPSVTPGCPGKVSATFYLEKVTKIPKVGQITSQMSISRNTHMPCHQSEKQRMLLSLLLLLLLSLSLLLLLVNIAFFTVACRARFLTSFWTCQLERCSMVSAHKAW